MEEESIALERERTLIESFDSIDQARFYQAQEEFEKYWREQISSKFKNDHASVEFAKCYSYLYKALIGSVHSDLLRAIECEYKEQLLAMEISGEDMHQFKGDSILDNNVDILHGFTSILDKYSSKIKKVVGLEPLIDPDRFYIAQMGFDKYLREEIAKKFENDGVSVEFAKCYSYLYKTLIGSVHSDLLRDIECEYEEQMLAMKISGEDMRQFNHKTLLLDDSIRNIIDRYRNEIKNDEEGELFLQFWKEGSEVLKDRLQSN